MQVSQLTIFLCVKIIWRLFQNEDDYGTECDQLIKMGAKFALGSSDWWWLGEQLMMQAVSSSSEFCGDGSKKEAIAKYIYGKYLVENRKWFCIFFY